MFLVLLVWTLSLLSVLHFLLQGCLLCHKCVGRGMSHRRGRHHSYSETCTICTPMIHLLCPLIDRHLPLHLLGREWCVSQVVYDATDVHYCALHAPAAMEWMPASQQCMGLDHLRLLLDHLSPVWFSFRLSGSARLPCSPSPLQPGARDHFAEPSHTVWVMCVAK